MERWRQQRREAHVLFCIPLPCSLLKFHRSLIEAVSRQTQSAQYSFQSPQLLRYMSFHFLPEPAQPALSDFFQVKIYIERKPVLFLLSGTCSRSEKRPLQPLPPHQDLLWSTSERWTESSHRSVKSHVASFLKKHLQILHLQNFGQRGISSAGYYL